MSLSDFFETFDDSCSPVNGADFQWSAKGVGFGGMYFYFDKTDSYVHCDNELMSREFLKKMLCKMVDECVLECVREDDESGGKPSGYDPKPYVERETEDDKDCTQG